MTTAQQVALPQRRDNSGQVAPDDRSGFEFSLLSMRGDVRLPPLDRSRKTFSEVIHRSTRSDPL
jgi:hypothetical protein